MVYIYIIIAVLIVIIKVKGYVILKFSLSDYCDSKLLWQLW